MDEIIPSALAETSEHGDNQAVETFDLHTILAGRLAESTIAMYRLAYTAYVAYAQEHALDVGDPATLIAWRDTLALDTTLSPHSINRMLSSVRRVMLEASRRGVLAEAMALRFQQVEGVKVRALKTRLKQHARTRISPEDMRRLCELPDITTLIGKRDHALLLFLASSGVRASEAATFTVGNMLKRGKGYLIQVCGKTDTELREAHLSAEAYNAVMDWLAARPMLSDAVFTSFEGKKTKNGQERATGAALSDTAIWKIVQRYAKQAGLDHLKPHDFRRFVGTQLARKDIRKAQLALGHKSIEVTARHYVLDKLEVGETDNLF